MDYLRMCWYYLFVYDVEKDGGQYKLTGWQHIRATDGPIHTLWCWQAAVCYNWFTMGFICWRRGHVPREQWVAQGRKISACARCGKFNGVIVAREPVKHDVR